MLDLGGVFVVFCVDSDRLRPLLFLDIVKIERRDAQTAIRGGTLLSARTVGLAGGITNLLLAGNG